MKLALNERDEIIAKTMRGKSRWKLAEEICILKNNYEAVKEALNNSSRYCLQLQKELAKRNGYWTRIESGQFPKESQFVFIMLHSGDIVQAQLDGDKWRFGEMFSVGKTAIVAWMPIPKLPAFDGVERGLTR